eukprot:1163783-Pleurochrysis_carterae.AAC.1
MMAFAPASYRPPTQQRLADTRALFSQLYDCACEVHTTCSSHMMSMCLHRSASGRNCEAVATKQTTSTCCGEHKLVHLDHRRLGRPRAKSPYQRARRFDQGTLLHGHEEGEEQRPRGRQADR